MILIGEIIKETKHLIFEVKSHKPKTIVVGVFNRSDSDQIGEISWYSPWRQYNFDPEYPTTWNHQCLKDVAEVLVYLNEDHKNLTPAPKK